MKKIRTLISLIVVLCIFSGKVFAQTIAASLTGYPIVTTGWVMGGSTTTVDSEIELLPNVSGSNGHIYYNDLLNVTACGSFSVDFDYEIVFTTGCLGDGIAFWFTNTTPTFVGGGSLGTPSTVNGIVFTMDTYDNDGDGNNPQHDLKGYAGTAYGEGPTGGGVLAPLVAHVTMADGTWHHVHISYNGGNIAVYLNYSTTPAQTGTYALAAAGYFGFSAGSGACQSAQYIKEVFITENPATPIFGVTTMCQGAASTLIDSATGGVWTSANTSVATVGSSTGTVYGAGVGTAVISYVYNSTCTATTTVNILPPIGGITGPSHLCAGTTITLADGTTGGTWSSNATSVATIGSTGVVYGNAAGTTTITYSTGGTCFQTLLVTVNTIPTAISGSLSVCTGNSTTLSDGVGGGSWSSSNTLINIGTGGVISGVNPGTTTITYSLGGVCVTSSVFTVNPTPTPIVGTLVLCSGLTTNLSDALTGGTWSSSVGSEATVTSPGGVVTANAPLYVVGTTTIVYTTTGNCTTSSVVTVNPVAPGIIGFNSACAGQYAQLSSSSGASGSWSSSNTNIATVGSAVSDTTDAWGVAVAGGTVTITFTVPSTGCRSTALLSVDSAISAIRPSNPLVCAGGSPLTLTDANGTGFWSSSNSTVASIDPISGVLGGTVAGLDTILYTAASGCSASVVVTVDGAPPGISGLSEVCPGATIDFTDVLSGGTWVSSAPSVATIGSSSGIAEGLVSGGTEITYTAPTGCYTTFSLEVYPSPNAFTPPRVCVGATTTVAETSVGGTWSATNETGDVTVTTGTLGGSVQGLSAGTAILTYTLSTCPVTGIATVIAAPAAISGPHSVCSGSAITLSDITSGGTWTSSNTSVASIGSVSGVLTGGALSATLTFETVTITYSTGGSCASPPALVTVNNLPVANTVSGGGSYCAGGAGVTVSLGGSTVGDIYVPYANGVSTGDTLHGTGASLSFTSQTDTGTYTIIGYNPSTGCSRTMNSSVHVSVTAAPAIDTVEGGGGYCSGGRGSAITLSGSSIGTVYSLKYGATTEVTVNGTGSPISFGTYAVAGTYTVTATSAGCSSPMYGSAVVTINPLPTAYAVSGSGSLCPGGSGVPLSLSGSSTGITYNVYDGPTLDSSIAGTGSALSLGSYAVAGTYTVTAVNAATGCTKAMTGSGIVTVSPAPVPGGPYAVCAVSAVTETVTGVTGTGTWVSSITSVATIGATSGVMGGITPGSTTTITYTSAAGCSASIVVTVTTGPSAIAGPVTVCSGSLALEADTVGGGTWWSSSSSVASVVGGSVTGGSVGSSSTVTLTYSLGGSCSVSKTLTVNVSPVISHIGSTLCAGSDAVLTGSPSGGTWISSNTSVATVGSTGTVYSVGLGVTGTTEITYTHSTCAASLELTVDEAPSGLTGPPSVCAGDSIQLLTSTLGGTWTSSNTLVATVSASGSGEVYGVLGLLTAGTATITYSFGGACTSEMVVSVSPAAAITGIGALCVGTTTTLSEAAGGGTWASGNTLVATVSGGRVGGVSADTVTIMYTTVGGCVVGRLVTVNAAPTTITGSHSLCPASCDTLSDAVSGGTWTSGNTAVAVIDASSGQVCAPGLPGTASITYSLGGAGCSAGTVVTVDSPPVTGSVPVLCTGGPGVALSATPVGGAWTSSNTYVASVTGAYVYGGNISGTATLTYYAPTGCTAMRVVTVNASPSAVTGTMGVCEGTTTSLSDATSGGVWTSGNTLIATVSAGGVVYGAASGGGGAVTISYTVGGCPVSAVVNVAAPPTGPYISGGGSGVCMGGTATMVDSSGGGGTWSVGMPSIATITSGGALTGLSSGTVLVSYTVGGGCSGVSSIVVSGVSAIDGVAQVCPGSSVTLSDTTGGGVWSSGNSAVAVVSGAGIGTGVVTGGSAGTATIYYTLPTGCAASVVATVVAGPGSISGPGVICSGSTASLSEGTSGGVWSSGNTSVAVVSIGGVVSGITTGGGTAMISYTVAGYGCSAVMAVTVNPSPPAIEGSGLLCVGSGEVLADILPGGVWSSSNTSVATVSVGGSLLSLSSGQTEISYSYGGCSASMELTVNGAPGAIIVSGGGSASVCVGQALQLLDGPVGGSWMSSDADTATVSGTGVATGVAAGIVTITYTTGAGCASTLQLTVQSIPGSIGGLLCQGAVRLTDTPPGGTWQSSNTAVLSVSASGTGTAAVVGTSTVTYTSAAGCAVSGTVTVNPSPGAISGGSAVCEGSNIMLSDTTLGGTWWSSDQTVATIDPGSGYVQGLAGGTTEITYSGPGTGTCYASEILTVDTYPGLLAGGMLCSGGTLSLSDTPGGGTWSSDNTLIATVDTFTGLLTGVNATGAAQTANITYYLSAGCSATGAYVVNPLPAAIGGATQVCSGSEAMLTDGTVDGVWSSGNPSVAFFGSPLSGSYTGESSGVALVSYIVVSTGCLTTTEVTVDVQPGPITGALSVCQGSVTHLGDTISGGVWTSGSGLVATVGSASGSVTGVLSPGTTTITYTLGICSSSAVVTVEQLPFVYAMSGGGSYCAGGGGVSIGLLGSESGVNYLLYLGAAATGTVAGTGSDITFGLQRAAGSYTVVGTDAATGCTATMRGTAAVTVTTAERPMVSVSVSPSDTVCSGSAATFRPLPVNGGGGPSYIWTVNGEPVSASGSYTYIPANGDVVVVTMTPNPDSACVFPSTASGSLTMTVLGLQTPVAGVMASPGDTVCLGSAIHLAAAPVYGGSTPYYTWTRNGAVSGHGPSYVYIPSAGGDSVYLTMSSDYPCLAVTTVTSNVVVVEVDTPQLPVVTITSSPGTLVTLGQYDTLTATVTGGGSNPQYQWVVNELPVSGATNNVYISNNYSYPGEDSVACVVTTGGVCSAVGYGWVYIDARPEGVQSATAGEGVTIVPNPNKGEFVIRGSVVGTTDEQVEIEITDMLGRQVYAGRAEAAGGRLNARVTLGGAVANGMYLLNLKSGTETTVFHIVVEQ